MFYSPTADRITLPPRELFRSPEEFYASLNCAIRNIPSRANLAFYEGEWEHWSTPVGNDRCVDTVFAFCGELEESRIQPVRDNQIKEVVFF
jgi:hypothetical protein